MKELLTFFRFFYRLRGRMLIYLIVLMVLTGLFEVMGVSLFVPILEGANPDTFLGRAFVSVLSAIGLEYSFTMILTLMVIFFFIRSLCLIGMECYIGKITAGLITDLRYDLSRRVFEAEYRYVLERELGYINNAIVVEVSRLVFAFQMYASVVSALIFALFYLCVPICVAPHMTLAALCLSVPFLFIIHKINNMTKEHSVVNSQERARLQRFLIQAIHHIKYLKSTHTYNNILNHVYDSSRKLGDTLFRQSVLQTITKSGFLPFVIFFVACFFYYQVHIEGGALTDVGFILLLLMGAALRLLSIQQNYRKFLTSFGSINVFKELDSALQKHLEIISSPQTSPDFSHPIIFKGVTFCYEPSKPVLKNISCTIPSRKTVAFVGPSGCGKSTLVTLVTGILQPSEGSISFGSIDYREIDRRKLQEGIGYVIQEGVIFSDTIRNNITLWKDGSDKELATAIEKAHVRELVDRASSGYDTLLGYNGIKISGGQRQRISIARELYKQAPLLIFDEATSSLDTAAEREIQKNIDEFKGERTILIVAHRLSTVKNCDMIFVLKQGSIIEQGTYDELMRKKGAFHNMVELQMMTTER